MSHPVNSQDNSESDLPYANKMYTVSEITREIRLILEEGFPQIWIQGEVSNFKKHSSGHLYFTLKDAEAQISCVMWRGRNRTLLFQPQDGFRVHAFGNISVYERQGKYQLDVVQLRPAGVGELQLAFEALKNQLSEEGLFDPGHKQPLPLYPFHIGVITSPTGAAIQDIHSVIQRRFPSVEMILFPVRVQGDGAAEEIVGAIEAFNEFGSADVIIVGRGGGSVEDLWAFNEEIVARAIYRSNIPIISAVGHEIDFSISDFVADVRAATPSAAGEIVVQDRHELIQTLAVWKDRLARNLENQIASYRERLLFTARSYGFRWPENRVREYQMRLDDLMKNLSSGMKQYLSAKDSNLSQLKGKLETLDPQAVLERGYSITTRLPEEQVVLQSSNVNVHDRIRIRFSQGSIKGVIEEIEA
jgi:exodeoxyribonuclease VII large subunit